MRKIAWILLLMLLLAAPGAYADTLPLAARLDMYTQFERYQGYEMEEATGAWSAYGLIAGQLLSTVTQGSVSDYMESGVCVLYPGVRGNRDLSLMEPVLYVCLLRSSPIQADALSVATGGMRYDFVGKPEQTKIGKYNCERFALPLDETGLKLLVSFAGQGGAVRVYGETRVFRTAIAEKEKYKNSKQRVEALSVAAVRDFLTLWPEPYALWNLNAAHWEKDRPKMAAVALREGGYAQGLPALESSTQCLDTQKGSAVRAYQQMLKDKAFFTASLASNYGKATRASTMQAQQYYGLLPTGMADRTLIELLSGVALPAEAESAAPVEPTAPTAPLTDSVQAKPGTAYVLENQLSIRLDRAWEAYALSPSRASDVLDRVAPTDRSNRLYVADGEIVNLSDQSVQLPLLLQGFVQMNGIRYPCVVQCERDEGRALGTTLLPMGKSRLLISCEVPEGIDLASCTLHLVIQAAAQKLELGF